MLRGTGRLVRKSNRKTGSSNRPALIRERNGKEKSPPLVDRASAGIIPIPETRLPTTRDAAGCAEVGAIPARLQIPKTKERRIRGKSWGHATIAGPDEPG